MSAVLSLAKLITVCGDITGRKKLQKVVHLLQIGGFRSQFPYEFGYLHYGPYSHGVKHDLDILTQEKLVREEESYAGEHKTFRYSPAQTLADDLNAVGVPASPDWEELANRLNAMTPQRLEAASTVAFLRERGFKGETLQTRFRELKPSLVREFVTAVKIVGEIQV